MDRAPRGFAAVSGPLDSSRSTLGDRFRSAADAACSQLACRAGNTQLLVIDPSSFVETVKLQLAEKHGIPLQHQRLTFAADHTTGEANSGQQPGGLVSGSCIEAEELLAESHLWKAILFENGRAIGQLCEPSLRPDESDTAVDLLSNLQSLLRGTGVQVALYQIVYDRWLPSWAPAKSPPKPLYIPLDPKFKQSSYRIQVIGRAGDRSFALPHRFEFSGRELGAALSLQQQRADYVRRHQEALGKPRPGPPTPTSASSLVPDSPAHPADVSIACGSGFERLSAVCDILDQPAWLKRVALPLTVATLNREAQPPRGPVAPPSAAPCGSPTQPPSGGPYHASSPPGHSAEHSFHHDARGRRKQKKRRDRRGSQPRPEPGASERTGPAPGGAAEGRLSSPPEAAAEGEPEGGEGDDMSAEHPESNGAPEQQDPRRAVGRPPEGPSAADAGPR
uniref:Uncharacterized protein n=3 Tax=Tetraselmis sp. GSL018 TaxID=582737 RepID=A0A061S5J1_9CHLO